MPLEGLLRGEGRRPHQVDHVALLQLQVTTGVDDYVRQTVALLADVVVINPRQVERLHATSHQVGDFRPLDLLGVVVAGLVHVVERVLWVGG